MTKSNFANQLANMHPFIMIHIRLTCFQFYKILLEVENPHTMIVPPNTSYEPLTTVVYYLP